MTRLSALLVATSIAVVPVSAIAGSAVDSFNTPGNILITDQFNNRVIEVGQHHHQIVWQFGSGDPNDCLPGASSVIAPNDAERLAGGLTLIAGTGTGACPDNRVLIVDQAGNIVFQYGQAGVAGFGPNQLNTPVFAIQEPSGNLLITDQGNNRLIRVDSNKNILWTYGPTSGPGALNAPNSGELLHNGHILIADENNNRVLEIGPLGRVYRMFGQGLMTVAFASRLGFDHTLIADSGNNRVLEIDGAGNTVFQHVTNTDPNSNPNPNPTGAVRLRNGNTLIADQFNNRVIEVTPAGNMVFQYGKTNVVGNGPNELNAPYSAVEIGQYIGVTKPAP